MAPTSMPVTGQSTNVSLPNEANGKANRSSPKASKNSRRTASQKSLLSQEQARVDNGDASQMRSYAQPEVQMTQVVEQPLYNEVVENSSCHPVVHAVPVDTATGTKLGATSVPISSTAARSSGTAATAVNDNQLHVNPNEFPSVAEVAEKSKEDQNQDGRNMTNSRDARPSSSPGTSAFVNRVSSIPTVAETVHLLTDSVDSVSRRNRVAKLAVDTTKQAAAMGVTLADRLATPMKPVLENVIQNFDERATGLLEYGLRKYPIICKQPSEIAIQLRNSAVSTADNTAHRVLAYKPASFVASLTAKTVLTVNRGVETVLHKAHLQAPNTHNQVFNTVDWFANGVLQFVDESQNGNRQPRTVAVA